RFRRFVEKSGAFPALMRKSRCRELLRRPRFGCPLRPALRAGRRLDGLSGPSSRPGCRGLGAACANRLRCRCSPLGLARTDVTVDLPTLVQLDAPGADLTLDLAGCLQLEAALGGDGSCNLAADDRVLGHDVAFDYAVLA